MKFTRDQKAEAFDNLPKDLKVVIMSNALARAFEEIGNKKRLPVDKTGALGELVIVTMLGLAPREQFQENVRNELGVNDLQASTITKSVNEDIFLKIREILKQEEEGGEVKPDSEESKIEVPVSPELRKEDILSEIENPTPAVHPISIADQTLPGPAKPLEITAAPAAKAPTPAQSADAVAREFIAGKMTEPVSLPTKKYTVDPYREPIA